MNDLKKCFEDYFSYFIKVSEFWKSSTDNSSAVLRPLFNLTEQLRLCSRAQLDEDFLLKFPKVKEKLLAKILASIEEEMCSVIKLQGEMKNYVDGLKSRLNAVEKAYSKFSPEDEEANFNAAVPSFGRLLENSLDVWRCFHVLWIGVKTSIDMVDYFNKDSIKEISHAFAQYQQVEGHFKYVSDLTFYLRTPSDS